MRALVRRLLKVANIRGDFYQDVLEYAVEKLKPDEKPTEPKGAPSAKPEGKADEAPPPPKDGDKK